MDDQQLRAICTLMNLSAPKGSEWCAWRLEMDDFIVNRYQIKDHIRFYLVANDSEFHEDHNGTLIWGD